MSHSWSSQTHVHVRASNFMFDHRPTVRPFVRLSVRRSALLPPVRPPANPPVCSQAGDVQNCREDIKAGAAVTQIRSRRGTAMKIPVEPRPTERLGVRQRKTICRCAGSRAVVCDVSAVVTYRPVIRQEDNNMTYTSGGRENIFVCVVVVIAAAPLAERRRPSPVVKRTLRSIKRCRRDDGCCCCCCCCHCLLLPSPVLQQSQE